ncbi:helix-turn-helix transcriptional regulator [Komagataeibacter kakiaceti JCM 25156]
MPNHSHQFPKKPDDDAILVSQAENDKRGNGAGINSNSQTDESGSKVGRHRELSHFLKTRRARLNPGDVGLPAGRGRRKPGLRREEIAVLAGVGLTWYTWFEQGRDIRVSTAFLENLARALNLDATERTYLFTLAQQRSPPAVAVQPSSDALAKIQAILDKIKSPAYARDNCFNVVAWNTANTQMFGDFAAVSRGERNIIWLTFSRPYHRQTMVNWEKDARSLVARFRMNYSQAAEDPALALFLQRMLTSSEDFRRMWTDHDVNNVGEGVYLYRTARHGIVDFQHSTLIPEAVPHLRIVVYLKS